MTTPAYEEIVDFIARMNPDEVSNFRASETARTHVADLIAREKFEGVSPSEAMELEQYLHLEHVMRLAKARAKQLLAVK